MQRPEPGTARSLEMLDAFADHVRSFISTDGLRPLKVVADTANGMGGLVVPKVFEALPFDLEVMYAELDGTFPNHPADPIQIENLADLRARVVEVGADIGLAFDGDADRVFLVDETGEPVSGSLTTALLARVTLRMTPGARIIYNLICSDVVPEVIAENGGTAFRSRVGHSFIKQLMAEEDAEFGGEHSAHYYFARNWRADSGLIAAVMVLSELSASGQTLSELLEPLKRYAASGEINTRVDDTAAVIEHVALTIADAETDRLDGLTVRHDDWWFNLRPSNTEPLLRLNLEAADDAAVACMSPKSKRSWRRRDQPTSLTWRSSSARSRNMHGVTHDRFPISWVSSPTVLPRRSCGWGPTARRAAGSHPVVRSPT